MKGYVSALLCMYKFTFGQLDKKSKNKLWTA